MHDKRERLLAAIGALEKDAASSVREPRSSRKASVRATRPRGQTQSAVLAYLAEQPGSSATAIADALGLKRNSTSTRLTQMAKAELIVKSEGRGYELTPSGVEPSVDAPADLPS